MKKYILLSIIMFACGKLIAETYELSFEGSGDTTVVDSVRVENLAKGTVITLAGDDILNVTVNPTVNSIPEYRSGSFSVRLTPNPMTEHSKLEIYSVQDDLYQIALYDISGRLLTSADQYLPAGKQEISIKGVGRGLYLLQVAGKRNAATIKLVSHSVFHQPQLIFRSGSSTTQMMDKSQNGMQKSAEESIDFECEEGEFLLLTAYAGSYTAVVTTVPESTSTIVFDFHNCVDADTNRYPVVTIGEQIWMAENLKTTRYNDGSEISLITDNASWADWDNTTAPGYCWYENNMEQYKATNGALYNWYAVDTLSNGSKNVCPSGWHVPSNDEWTELIDYLGGINEAGGKMKSTTASAWSTPNTGATNSSGFTGMATGLRMWDGPFNFINERGVFWSSTQNGEYGSWMRRLAYDERTVLETFSYKGFGFSVRCVLDE